MTTLDSISERKGHPTGRNPIWELSPDAPGVRGWEAGTRPVGSTPQYDEVDRRLMDTFPASDAVGRY